MNVGVVAVAVGVVGGGGGVSIGLELELCESRPVDELRPVEIDDGEGE